MKILIQKSFDRDAIGITNALAATRKFEIMLWNPEQDDIKDANPDIYIFTENSGLGKYVTNNIDKSKEIIFFKTDKPAILNGRVIKEVPICADLERYPKVSMDKSLYCDLFYLSNFEDRSDFFKSLNKENITFRAAGFKQLSIPNYIGSFHNQKEAMKFCVSASICIDFNLESAIDLCKIGCRVITNKENSLGIPTFTEDNVNEVVANLLTTRKPILNKYDRLIKTYSQYIEELI